MHESLNHDASPLPRLFAAAIAVCLGITSLSLNVTGSSSALLMKGLTALLVIVAGAALALSGRTLPALGRNLINGISLVLLAAGLLAMSRALVPEMTAFNLLMSGLCLLLLFDASRVRVVAAAACAMAFTSLLGAMTYAYGVPAAAIGSPQVRMSPLAALAFLLLGTGVLAALREHHGLARIVESQAVLKRLLPAAIAVPFLFGWVVIALERRDAFGHELGVLLLVAAFILVFAALVGWTSSAVERAATLRHETERKLRESERRFRGTFEQAAIGLAMVAPDGSWIEVNDRITAIIGYSREELLGLTFQDITHPDDLATDLDLVQKVIAGEIATYTLEKRYIHKNGSIVFVNLTVSLVRDEEGKPHYFVSAIEDITERKRIETELRESERRFREVANSLPQLVWTCTPEGPCDFLSRQWIDYTGIAEKNQLGFGWLQQLHPDDQQRTIDTWNAAVASGNDLQVEFRVRRHDGEYRWFDTRATRMRDSHGQVVKWFGSNTDITERRDLEASAKRESTFITNAINALPGLFYVIDGEGRFLRWNENLEKISGYTREEIDRITALDFFHGDDRSLIAARIGEAFASGEASAEAGFVTRDGRSIPYYFTGRRIVLDNVTCLVGMGIDISARQKAESELRSIEWMLSRREDNGPVSHGGQAYGDLTKLNRERVILDSVGRELLDDIVRDYLNLLETSSAVYEKNGDYALGIFSSGWCRSMDMASYEKCGTNDPEIALRCGRWECHESCWNEASRVSMETNAPADIECRGGIHLYAVPIRAGDEIIGSINFGYGDPPTDSATIRELAARYCIAEQELIDNARQYRPRPPFIIELAKERLAGSARLIGEIVQRRRAEDSLRDFNATLENRVRERTKQLEDAVSELESFSYSVSHDLRAPLRAIDGFSNIIATQYAEGLPEGAQSYLARVRNNAQQMGHLIDDLLTFSRLNRQSLHVQIVSPETVIDECLELLHAEIEARELELIRNSLPMCEADGGLLKLVWLNLLSNALKFTRRCEKARIEIGCLCNGEDIYFVRDNGVGFSMKYAEKLFGVFQRLHRAEDYEGTGVGLATVRRIITRHGGKVWAEAELNRGATFFFTLKPEAEHVRIR